jgi:protein-tyrosine-phosphatase
MTNILFVCTNNEFRSVLAEDLFKEALCERGLSFPVSSGGSSDTKVYGCKPISAVRALAKGSENYRATPVTKERLAAASHVIVMAEKQTEKLKENFPDFSFEKLYYLRAFDPAANGKLTIPGKTGSVTVEECSEVRNNIAKCIPGLLNFILAS